MMRGFAHLLLAVYFGFLLTKVDGDTAWVIPIIVIVCFLNLVLAWWQFFMKEKF